MHGKFILGLNVCYKDIENRKTEFIVDNKALKKSRELYNEIDSIGLPGIILVNYLNNTDKVIDILDSFKIRENIPVQTQMLNLKEEFKMKLKYIPLKIVVTRMIESFEWEVMKFGIEKPSPKYLHYYLYESKNIKSTCSTFFKILYEYVSQEYYNNKNNNVFNFSTSMLIEMFIDSLKTEIRFILENCEKDIIEIPEGYQVDEFEVGKLIDLFYISKYQMQKVNKRIKRCKICNKYFVTKGNKTTEVYCRRKYKGKKYTCQEFGTYSKRKIDNTTYDLRGDLKRELNNTTTMLRKQDKDNNTNLKDDFMKRYKIKFSELEALEISEDEILQMKLDWLKEQHEILKKKNSHKI